MTISGTRLFNNEPLPPAEELDWLVIMGGPMNVHQEAVFPWLRDEKRYIHRAVELRKTVLGICLGAQIIAHCLGATVYKGPKKEIGWHHIKLSGDGLKDQCMRQLAIHPRVGDFWRQFKVMHWHGDTFDLPPGAVLLASSDLYSHQAFSFGKSVYGLQFHIEVTKEMVADWFQNSRDKNKIVQETDRIFEEYSGRARNFYKAFFKNKSTHTKRRR